MSTGADCYFAENEDGSWTVSLQSWPYGESEEYDRCTGTLRECVSWLNQWANPGGYSISTYAPAGTPWSERRALTDAERALL